MMDTTYDVIVVGAGIVGSSTAYHLAKDGATVLLLDQVNLALKYPVVLVHIF